MKTGESGHGRPEKDEHWLERADNARRRADKRRPSAREYRREETLADWLGPELVPERFADLRPETLPIGELVAGVLERSGYAESYLLDRLRQEWPAVIGAANARFLLPCALRNGILTIEVTHPTWMVVVRGDQRDRLDQTIIAFAEGRIQRVNYVPRGRFAR